MQTINDIQFNNNLYSQVKQWALILYQMNGSSIAIPLPYAHLMTFIQVFDDIARCQHHINTNNEKLFTLFAYSENIETWLLNNKIPDHLDEIIIFCLPSDDQQYLKSWGRRYTDKIKDINSYDELQRDLLLFGMKYIKKLFSYFQDDGGILNLLKADYKKLGLALIDSFAKEVNKQDTYINTSVETT
ncbi:unnamed protein product [Adineta steineri]|uniref:Uncharacterized protein n=1 Tax=Adineta steineri TaxID=433720 RepID=A0A818WA37_9BILA|nr:unnamed protein product [Adineta steineri]CAF3723226.1 unnamed protein product [Adineta steineri]